MHHFLNAFKIAWCSLGVNKARTFLTILGIVIGITSIIIVYSAGEGIRGLMLGQIESFGTNIIQTEVKVPSAKSSSQGGGHSGVQITTLKLKDVEDLKNISNVQNGYGAVMDQEQVAYGGEVKKVFALGVNASYINIDSSEIASGRFYSESEDKSLAQVVVLGYKINKDLFGDSDSLGKFVTLRKGKYQVIGVMKEKGKVMVMDFDNFVYLPIRTLQKKITGMDHLMYMVHELKDSTKANNTADEARLILRQNHDISNPDKDDFRVVTMSDMMETLDTIMGALTILLLAIVIISLIVGGVGILNVMYVVVSERTSEIGLRKAVGAGYREIMWQFLVEAIVITLLGGIVGVVLGVIASWLIAWGARIYGLDWVFIVPVKAYVVALGFSLLFGIFFGIQPARKAAKMDPIVALRKE
ncbi:MAG: ABC transporter permease [Planctomycetes bacterium]|jgi:putative ABC transport system permease protein|nr:ABC transporter permease [Planctomycetota bacterium]